MIVGSLLLILVAVVTLGAGLAQGSDPLLVGSITASLLAAVTLIVGARRPALSSGFAPGRTGRRGLLADPVGDPAAPVADAQPAGADLRSSAGATTYGPGLPPAHVPNPAAPGTAPAGTSPAPGEAPAPQTRETSEPVSPAVEPVHPVTEPAHAAHQVHPAAAPSSGLADEATGPLTRPLPDMPAPPRHGRDDSEPVPGRGSDREPEAPPEFAPVTAQLPVAPPRGEPGPGDPAYGDLIESAQFQGDPARGGPRDLAGPVDLADSGVAGGDGDWGADDDPPDEPAALVVSAAARERVSGITADVLVVDGRPRYHLPGCAHLHGRDSEPLPVGEAISLGFTPCSLCEPDLRLLEQATGD